MIWSRWVLLGLALTTLLFGQGCTTFGSTSKAPILKVHTGGTKNERKQEFLLKQIKSDHKSSKGIMLGLRHFTDGGRPISGAREKDTLYIQSGPYKGSYTVDKVLRLVTGRGKRRRRRVIIRTKEPFFDNEKVGNWKTIHRGSQGVATGQYTFTDAVSDASKFPPEANVGNQLKITQDGVDRYFTIVGNTIDRKVGKLQRVAYRTSEPLPAGLRNLRYELREPVPAAARKIKYRIAWRGSSLSGYNFTIGINRRRYGQKEIEDLLKSNPKSRQKISGVAVKRNTSLVMRSVGLLAIGVGGFLALVRRDDFPGAQQAIPWSIVGAGAVMLLGVSVPLDVSANSDFLAAQKAYNKDIRQRLGLKRAASLPQPTKKTRVAGPAPTGRSVLLSTK